MKGGNQTFTHLFTLEALYFSAIVSQSTGVIWEKTKGTGVP